MRRPRFIARQAERPSGLFGRFLGAIMAVETRALNDEVLRHLAVAAGERILEIGFGHGRTIERAAKATAGARFAGIDHAEDMVEALSRRAHRLVDEGRLELRAGNSSALPWPEASFDGAFTVHTIYFWADPAPHLAEIHRVLRSGGRLMLAFRDRTPDVEASAPPDIYHLRSRDDVLALLAVAGFETTATAGPGTSNWIVDARKR
ncbi:MAG TPA: class I SAM-dependent methyltransferase [Sphingomicrobium sp.]|jgi:ubiquinone/menaquinone biosynthesis C-methylase UbiE|nr:class I SAM-dependent methyltransferase [Sphingomicrobium sp.]